MSWNKTSAVTRLAIILLFVVFGAGLSSKAKAQVSPTGKWDNRFDEDEPERIPGPEIGDYLGLPINDAARLRADSWVATLLELPENQCRPHPSDYAWRGPALLRIWDDVDRLTQRQVAYHTHISWQQPEQTIWLDGRPKPPIYAEHTWQGYSTGKWEGDILSYTTDHLKEGWIRRNGVPRSDQANISTHIMRHADYLTVAVIVYDPLYLTEPFIRTTDFFLNPQQVMAPYPCEVVDETGRKQGEVPSHLLGENTFLQEFAANYGIPPEAARGGAETMYPEYIDKLQGMKKLPRPAGVHHNR